MSDSSSAAPHVQSSSCLSVNEGHAASVYPTSCLLLQCDSRRAPALPRPLIVEPVKNESNKSRVAQEPRDCEEWTQ